ncbi:MAG: T9SS type A sorting domain-containing protein, partial [Bacteroidetes bacterium]|nr:T9SS type A sorting domain-containing protein [Bacteroidota bacterium]
GDLIRCNKICSNSTYGLRYTGSNNTQLPYARENIWCSNDSATIAAIIYDGYDNVSSGLVNFTPLGANSCALNVGVPHYRNTLALSVSPNPSNGKFTIKFPQEVRGALFIRDISGALIYTSAIGNTNELNIGLDTAPGIYFLEFRGETFSAQRKLVLGD